MGKPILDVNSFFKIAFDMRYLLFCLCFLITFPLFSQEAKPSDSSSASFMKTITLRSEKIVSALQIPDSVMRQRVTAILVKQYADLNKVYADRDNRVKAIRSANAEKKVADSMAKTVEEAFFLQAQQLHQPFLKRLSTELSEEQVIKVKDGMTYSVLPITYKAYLEMIPTLKQVEKDQIRTWLTEAREIAMDAESSDKKHWWFGKYKGRINNYLAAQGYDLQKERKEWGERQKAEEEKKKALQ